MKQVLRLASLGRGFTGANPLVGCVVIKNDTLIGSGYHAYFGGAHAEVMAISKIKESDLADSTVYCNLEPCTSWPEKKTPPCAELLLNKKIKRIVIAHQDPRPQINGRSIERLRNNGIQVDVGLLSSQAAWMNRSYLKWIATGIPYVRLKFAQSLDGKLHPTPLTRKQISGPESQTLVQHLRARSQAIIIGGNTERIDSPKLTVRLEKFLTNPHFVQPKRLVLSNSKIKLQSPTELGVWLKNLGEQGISSVLVEAGPFWQQEFLSQNLFDETLAIISPKFLGPGLGIVLKNEHSEGNFSSFDYHTWKRLGADIVLQGIKLKGNPCLQELLNI
ncbi:MAG: bifunctional diaminohydroxyphosphoribosylaminopyrimidine deaminase/5-amino-6-(5-phosphoribosylamino)uracil reductase RibD [Bacteriovoracaceae bacterium]|nr:bifunctional diaminohydroxyphosphoribosylaminopyrimidine deaminase/5-amino-6-(5-phosphoribosylamino)uracil reductase RibD [Bacteriovoracaceae bacterium]